MKILLDYFFPITTIDPTPAASTAFLKQVLIVVKPTGSLPTTDTIVLCTTNAQVAVQTANTEAAQLFNAGMTRIYVLATANLDIADLLEGHETDFFTILVSSDFSDAEVTATAASGNITITSYANLLTTTPDSVGVAGVTFTAQSSAVVAGSATFRAATGNTETGASLADQINAHATAGALVTAVASLGVVTITAKSTGKAGNSIALAYTDNGGGNIGATKSGTTLTGGDGLSVGEFNGVIGVQSTDDAFLTTHAAIANRAAFHTTSGNKAKNMFYAFGKLLSNALAFRNQQYISMPVADDINTLGGATALFDANINFVLTDDEFSQRLGFFAAGGEAIIAPYVKKNLQIDMQSAALTYVSGNQPEYTHKHAALIEDELQKVINSYISDGLIEEGTADVSLEEDNFIASAEFSISEPNALWRIFGETRTV